MEFALVVIVLGLLLLLVFLLAAMGIRIVAPYEKGVVERLGRYLRTAQPGATLHHSLHRCDAQS